MVEDFAPSPEEQALYDRVSEYLRREDASAIQPGAAHAAHARLPEAPGLLDLRHRAHPATGWPIAGAGASPAKGAAAWPSCPELAGFAEEAEEWDDANGAAPRRTPSLRRLMEAELAELRDCARAARDIRVNAKGEAL